MRFAVFYSSFALALLDLVSAQTNSSNSSLPVVDLGYELHQAALFNVCHQRLALILLRRICVSKIESTNSTLLGNWPILYFLKHQICCTSGTRSPFPSTASPSYHSLSDPDWRQCECHLSTVLPKLDSRRPSFYYELFAGSAIQCLSISRT